VAAIGDFNAFFQQQNPRPNRLARASANHHALGVTNVIGETVDRGHWFAPQNESKTKAIETGRFAAGTQAEQPIQ
jgi:hypothetical protein